MADETERELSRLFDELRRADDRAVPGFARVLERARASTRPRVGPLPRVGLAAAALLFLALILASPWLGRRGRAGPESAVAAWKWTSPTAFLLETPGSELFESPPPLVSAPPAWTRDGRPRPSSPTEAPPTPRRPRPPRLPEKGAAS